MVKPSSSSPVLTGKPLKISMLGKYSSSKFTLTGQANSLRQRQQVDGISVLNSPFTRILRLVLVNCVSPLTVTSIPSMFRGSSTLYCLVVPTGDPSRVATLNSNTNSSAQWSIIIDKAHLLFK